MNEEKIYEVEPAFRIGTRPDPRPAFGSFFFTRLLYWLECEGRAWQVTTFAAVVGMLTLPALSLDLITIIFVYIAKILYKIFCGVWRLILYAAAKIFESISSALKFIFIAAIIIFIVAKWQNINAILASLDFLKIY